MASAALSLWPMEASSAPPPPQPAPWGRQTTSDAGSLQLQLNGARDVVAATVGGNTYLFVAGLIDDGVEVLSVAN